MVWGLLRLVPAFNDAIQAAPPPHRRHDSALLHSWQRILGDLQRDGLGHRHGAPPAVATAAFYESMDHVPRFAVFDAAHQHDTREFLSASLQWISELLAFGGDAADRPSPLLSALHSALGGRQSATTHCGFCDCTSHFISDAFFTSLYIEIVEPEPLAGAGSGNAGVTLSACLEAYLALACLSMNTLCMNSDCGANDARKRWTSECYAALHAARPPDPLIPLVLSC
jgi:hypothetical protein